MFVKALSKNQIFPERGRFLQSALIFFLLPLLVLSPLVLFSCSRNQAKRYSSSFTGTFDTAVQLIAYADSQAQFNSWFELARQEFGRLHELFDIYNEYAELDNLATVNRQAGLEAVQVDQEIIDLIELSIELDRISPGTVNIAFGPVLSIWHDFRTAALAGQEVAVPAQEQLAEAARHCDLSQVIIDREKKTVFLAQEGMRLDVGAIAKGYATELVAEELAGAGLVSGIISAGGSNVRLVGQPADGRASWQVGLQDPAGNPLIPDEAPLDVVLANDQSIVTSGDYQRYLEVDGVIYHHLIDTTTLQPASHYRAVTVMSPDSGVADFLSTLFFLLPFADSYQLAGQITDCEVLWIFPDNHIEATPGMLEHLQSARAD
jgi:thiamine biosynthesis lipoprotein